MIKVNRRACREHAAKNAAQTLRCGTGRRFIAGDRAEKAGRNSDSIGRWRKARMALKVGDTAPDFELPAIEGERKLKVKLSDFRGKKHVVVAFHPLDWTPT